MKKEKLFKEYMAIQDKEIAKEQSIIDKLCPLESNDDILYELILERRVLQKCYDYIFKIK